MKQEHPLVALVLATGQVQRPGPGRLCCSDCGSWLRPGDSCYPVAGEIFCQRCMADRREEVRW